MIKRKIDFSGPSLQDLGLENQSEKKGKSGITNNTNTKKTRKTVYPKLIRDYLNAALGDNERAEIKLSVMENDLNINPKTLYKHLKVLRETEFYITKLQYCTEIRRR